MIKINLLISSEKKTTDGLTGMLEQKVASNFFEQLKKINFKTDAIHLEQVKKFILPLILGIMVWFVSTKWQERQINTIAQSINEESLKLKVLEKKEADLKILEPIKKTFEDDELNFIRKISTLKHLIDLRTEMSKILTTLPRNLPETVWLKGLAVEPQKIKLSGTALGFTAISDFMRNIKENALFSELHLGKSERSHDIQDKDNREFASFDLEIKRK